MVGRFLFVKMNWIIQQFLLTEFRFDTKLIGKNGSEISANAVVVQKNKGSDLPD